jgi:outer membrane protein TolC
VKALRLIVLGLVAGLTACAVGPSYRTPKPDEPPSFAAKINANSLGAGAQPTNPPLDLATWWRALNDEELDSLVDRAVKSNLDLEIALDSSKRALTKWWYLDMHCRT